jgi:N-acetylmuramoyl-L-alanine amidase
LPRAVAALADPPRVYADLSHAVLEESYREESDAGAVREIRMAQQPAEPERPVARLVVEMREEQAYTVFSDRDDLIIAVGPQPWALPLSEYQAAEQLKGKRIVVDPGHGGEDIGAPAVFGPPPRGPFEKDIVLDIGQRLAKLLAAEGAEVTMTREDDTYITLQERAALANRLRADAFISIHCDSCDNPNTLSGTSVYYDHAHSARFAQLVQGELTAALGTRNKGVRNANFAVIRRTQGPGILVETAYINHEQDRARLIHPNFRERAARAIARGLIEFTNGPSADRDAGA